MKRISVLLLITSLLLSLICAACGKAEGELSRSFPQGNDGSGDISRSVSDYAASERSETYDIWSDTESGEWSGTGSETDDGNPPPGPSGDSVLDALVRHVEGYLPVQPSRGVLNVAAAENSAGDYTAVQFSADAEAAASLEADLPGLIALQCDVASRAACESAFTAAEIMLGHVDVLVCNAGIAQQKLFTDITPAEWQHMLDVNLTGAFHLCQLALPGMIRRKWGRILTVSSMWGQTGGSCEVHYSAAKAGLIGLTKALAREEGPSGVTVNCVAPGVIDTDMMAAFTPGDKAALAEETPVGRLGSAQEVARALLFLAGEEAGYITGQVFGVNGGLVI